MSVKFCTLHQIGYNPELDPTCPQCMVSRQQPPDQLDVDLNPGSEGYGFPIEAGSDKGSRKFRKVAGR